MKIVNCSIKYPLMSLLLTVLVLTVPLQNVDAQQKQAACQLLTSDRSWSEPIKVDFETCANNVFVANAILHTQNAFGIWGKTVLNVDTSGDVQTATVDDTTQIDFNSLSWEDWGNISEGQTSPNQSQEDPTATPVPEPLTLDEIFVLAKDDINDFWTGVLAKDSADYTEPDVVVYDTAKVRTRCGTAPSEIGPFYCVKDNTAYFPRDFMADQHDRIGDYAVVVIIAHEWGHAIQAQVDSNTGISIQRELQADCYAGAYSQYALTASKRVVLEDGDIDEATASLFEAGDSGGGSWFDGTAHGDGEQRQAAFNNGLNNGYESC